MSEKQPSVKSVKSEKAGPSRAASVAEERKGYICSKCGMQDSGSSFGKSGKARKGSREDTGPIQITDEQKSETEKEWAELM